MRAEEIVSNLSTDRSLGRPSHAALRGGFRVVFQLPTHEIEYGILVPSSFHQKYAAGINRSYDEGESKVRVTICAENNHDFRDVIGLDGSVLVISPNGEEIRANNIHIVPSDVVAMWTEPPQQ